MNPLDVLAQREKDRQRIAQMGDKLAKASELKQQLLSASQRAEKAATIPLSWDDSKEERVDYGIPNLRDEDYQLLQDIEHQSKGLYPDQAKYRKDLALASIQAKYAKEEEEARNQHAVIQDTEFLDSLSGQAANIGLSAVDSGTQLVGDAGSALIGLGAGDNLKSVEPSDIELALKEREGGTLTPEEKARLDTPILNHKERSDYKGAQGSLGFSPRGLRAELKGGADEGMPTVRDRALKMGLDKYTKAAEFRKSVNESKYANLSHDRYVYKMQQESKNNENAIRGAELTASAKKAAAEGDYSKALVDYVWGAGLKTKGWARLLADNPQAAFETMAESAVPLALGASGKAGVAALSSINASYAAATYNDNVLSFIDTHGRVPTSEERTEMALWAASAAALEQVGDLVGAQAIKGMMKVGDKAKKAVKGKGKGETEELVTHDGVEMPKSEYDALRESKKPTHPSEQVGWDTRTEANKTLELERYKQEVKQWESDFKAEKPTGQELIWNTSKDDGVMLREKPATTKPETPDVTDSLDKAVVRDALISRTLKDASKHTYNIAKGTVTEGLTEEYQTAVETGWGFLSDDVDIEQMAVAGALGAGAGGAPHAIRAGLSTTGKVLAAPGAFMAGGKSKKDKDTTTPKQAEVAKSDFDSAVASGDTTQFTNTSNPGKYDPVSAMKVYTTRYEREEASAEDKAKDFEQAEKVYSDHMSYLQDLNKQIENTTDVKKQGILSAQLEHGLALGSELKEARKSLVEQVRPAPEKVKETVKQAATDKEAATKAVVLYMRDPEAFTQEDVDTLAQSEMISETARDWLVNYSKAQAAVNSAQSMANVTKDVSDGRSGFKGLNEYFTGVSTALSVGNVKQAIALRQNLRNFQEDHLAKQKTLKAALDWVNKAGKEGADDRVAYVVRDVQAKGNWRLSKTEPEGWDKNANGGLEVATTVKGKYTNMHPKHAELLNRISKENEAIQYAEKATRSQLQAYKEYKGERAFTPDPLDIEGALGNVAKAKPEAKPEANTEVKPEVKAEAAPVTSETSTPVKSVKEEAVEPVQTQEQPRTEETPVTDTNTSQTQETQPEAVTEPQQEVVQEQAQQNVEEEVQPQEELSQEEQARQAQEAWEGEIEPDPRDFDEDYIDPDEVVETDFDRKAVKERVDALPDGKLSQLQGDPETRLKGNLSTGELKQANLASSYLVQRDYDDDAETSMNPLVRVKDFISTLKEQDGENVNTDLLSYFLPEGHALTEKELAYVELFTKFFEASYSKIANNLKNSADKGEFSYRNIAEDFKGDISENLITAVAFAAFSYAAEQGGQSDYMNESMLKSLLRLDSSSRVPNFAYTTLKGIGNRRSVVINDLGARITRSLGIQAHANAPMNIQSNLESSLGSHAIKVLVDMGMVYDHLVPSQYLNPEAYTKKGGFLAQQVYNGEVNSPKSQREAFIAFHKDNEGNPAARTQRILDASKKTNNVLNELFNFESSLKTPTDKPVRNKQKTVKAKQSKMPSIEKELINEANEHAYVLDSQIVDSYNLLEAETVYRIAGAEPVQKYVPNEIADRVKATRDAVVRGVDMFMEFVESRDILKPFFFEGIAWSNQRIGLTSQTINPLTDKFHRGSMYQKAWETEVDASKFPDVEMLEEDTKLQGFLLALGQGFGFAVDKENVEASIVNVLATLTNTTDPRYKAIQVLRNVSSNTGDKLSAEDQAIILAGVEKGGEATHTYQVMVQAADYLNAIEAEDRDTVTSRIALEIDGLTNGPALTQILLGTELDEAKLASFGFFTEGSEHQDFSGWKAVEGNYDLYEATQALTIRAIQASNVPRESLEPIFELTGATMTEDGAVTGAGRKILKRPVTAIHFGSGMGTVVQGMQEDFIDLFYTRLQEGLNKEYANDAERLKAVQQYVRWYNRNFLVTKKLDGLIPAPKNMEEALALRLTPRQEKLASAIYDKNYGGFAAAGLEEKFGAFIKDRKNVDTASAMAYARYKQAFDYLLEKTIADKGQSLARANTKGDSIDDWSLRLLKTSKGNNSQAGVKRSLVNKIDYLKGTVLSTITGQSSVADMDKAITDLANRVLIESDAKGIAKILAPAKEAYDEAHSAKNKVGKALQDITKEDLNGIIEQLKPIEPIINTALSQMSGSLEAGFNLFKYGKEPVAIDDLAYSQEVHFAEAYVTNYLANKADAQWQQLQNKTITVRGRKKVMKEIGVGTTPGAAHSFDAGISINSYAENNGLNVHDANYYGVNDLEHGAKTLNGNTMSLLVNYSLPLEMADMLERTGKGVKQLPKDVQLAITDVVYQDPRIDEGDRSVDLTDDGVASLVGDFIEQEGRKLTALSKVTKVTQYNLEGSGYEVTKEDKDIIQRKLDALRGRYKAELSSEQITKDSRYAVADTPVGRIGDGQDVSYTFARFLKKNSGKSLGELGRPLIKQIYAAHPGKKKLSYRKFQSVLFNQLVRTLGKDTRVELVTPDNIPNATDSDPVQVRGAAAWVHTDNEGQTTVYVKSNDLEAGRVNLHTFTSALIQSSISQTYKRLGNTKKAKNIEDRSVVRAIKEMEELHTQVVDKLKADGKQEFIIESGIQHFEKFMVEGLQNPELMKVLEEMTVQSSLDKRTYKTTFARYIHKVAQILFGKNWKQAHTNGLVVMFGNMANVMSAERASRKGENNPRRNKVTYFGSHQESTTPLPQRSVSTRKPKQSVPQQRKETEEVKSAREKIPGHQVVSEVPTPVVDLGTVTPEELNNVALDYGHFKHSAQNSIAEVMEESYNDTKYTKAKSVQHFGAEDPKHVPQEFLDMQAGYMLRLGRYIQEAFTTVADRLEEFSQAQVKDLETTYLQLIEIYNKASDADDYKPLSDWFKKRKALGEKARHYLEVEHPAKQLKLIKQKLGIDLVQEIIDASKAPKTEQEGAEPQAVEKSVEIPPKTPTDSVWGKVGQTRHAYSNSLYIFFEQHKEEPSVSVKQLKEPLRQALVNEDHYSGNQEQARFQRYLAEQMFRILPDDVEIHYLTPSTPASDLFTVEEGMKTAYGWKMPNSNTIYVKSPHFVDSKLTPELLVHELLHVAVGHLQERRDNGTLDAKRTRALETLEGLREVLKGSVTEAEARQFSEPLNSIDEFLTYGMTNEAFQRFLMEKLPKTDQLSPELQALAKKIKVDKNKSSLAQFIRALVELVFGRNTTGLDQGFGLFITSAGILMEQDKKKPSPKNPKKQDTKDKDNDDDNSSSPQQQTLFMRDPASLSHTELFEALGERNVGRRLDPGFKQHLQSLLGQVVELAHGAMGIHADTDATKFTSDTVDVFIESMLSGELPFVSKLPAYIDMNAQEAYVAEGVESALRQSLATSRTQQNKARELFDYAKENLNPEDLYNGDWSGLNPERQATYESMYKAIFTIEENDKGGSDYLSSFLAASLTYQPLYRALQKLNTPTVQGPKTEDLTGQLDALIRKGLFTLGKLITGTVHDKSALELASTLTKNMVRLRAKQVRNLSQVRSLPTDSIESRISSMSEGVRKGLQRLGDSRAVQNSKVAPVKLAGTVTSLAAEGKLGTVSQKIIESARKDDNKFVGTFSKMMTEIIGEQADNSWVHRLHSLGTKVQQDVVRQSSQVSTTLLHNFKRKLKDAERDGITRALLRTDVVTLLGYTLGNRTVDTNHVIELLENPSDRGSAISVIEDKLRKDLTNEKLGDVLRDAKALAYFMVTEISTVPLLKLNAHNIQRTYGLTNAQTKDLDALVSLYALNYTSSSDLLTIARLAREEQQKEGASGIDVVLETHKLLKEEASETIFVGNKTNMIKGYVPDLNDPNHDIKLVPIEEHDLMLARGYVAVQEENDLVGDQFVKEPARKMYIARGVGKDVDVAGALLLSGNHRRGTLLGSKESLEATNNAHDSLEQYNKRQVKLPHGSLFDPRMSKYRHSAVPVYRNSGSMIPAGYRYMMQGSTKDAVLNRDNRMDKILGHMAGTLKHKTSVPVHNQQVIKGMYEHWKRDYLKDPKQFIRLEDPMNPNKVISPDESEENRKLREYLYDRLDQATYQRIVDVWGSSNIYVHKDFVDTLFGYSKKRVGNFLETTPKDHELMRRFVQMLFKQVFGQKAAVRAKQIGNVWSQLVTMTKDIVVIKNFVTMVGNEISNISLLFLAGVPLHKAIRDKTIAYGAARQYQKDRQEAFELGHLVATGLYSKKEEHKARQRITQLNQAMQSSPVHNLISEGMFQTIVEDITQENEEFTFGGSVKQWLDKYTFAESENRGVQAVRSVGKNILQTHDSGLYKVMNELTVMSDFTSRYAMYQHVTQRKRNPMTHDEAIRFARRAFVNYDVPTDAYVQWLNDSGLWMFTKYYMRIQAVIMDLVKTNPARALSLMAMDYISPMTDIMDSSVLFNAPGNISNGPIALLDAWDEPWTIATLLGSH